MKEYFTNTKKINKPSKVFFFFSPSHRWKMEKALPKSILLYPHTSTIPL